MNGDTGVAHHHGIDRFAVGQTTGHLEDEADPVREWTRGHGAWTLAKSYQERGDVIDIPVQSRRDRLAATRFFRKLLKGQGREPRRLVTDKLRSYAAAHRTVMPSVVHSTRQYENNRAEVSHQPTRQRE